MNQVFFVSLVPGYGVQDKSCLYFFLFFCLFVSTHNSYLTVGRNLHEIEILVQNFDHKFEGFVRRAGSDGLFDLRVWDLSLAFESKFKQRFLREQTGRISLDDLQRGPISQFRIFRLFLF